MSTHDFNAAKLAHDMGYNVAGFIEEIFEGAEVLIPDLMFGHKDDYTGEEKYNNKFLCGTVLSIQPVFLQHDDPDERYYNDFDDDDGPLLVTTKRTTPHFVVHFVLMNDEGIQAPLSYGRGHEVYFRIPTN